MPLHTDDGFELGALHRLDDAIGRGGCDAEAVARFAYCLMMERIDGEGVSTLV